MARKEFAVTNVAEAYLALLAERGIEYLFANAGTDFAPLVEAFAKAARTGIPVPQPVLAAHENLALSMAHGYAMVSRRVPAVMVHVSVGTANGVCGALNAARENVPILFTAGRSPLTESELPGARDVYIHWAQEMFDQAGMLREIVKWEYELRNGQQLETVIDRALAIATTSPSGPVYLSLPREVLAAPLSGFSCDAPSRRLAAAPAGPDKDGIRDAARILAAADNPLVITASAGRDLAAVGALADFAQRFAIPVVQHRPRHLCLPSEHPSHLGYDAAPFLNSADAILVLECDVPWIPSLAAPPRHCKVIHLGVDPLFSRYPIRGFPCDLAITGSSASALPDLAEAMERPGDGSLVQERRRRLAGHREKLLNEWRKTRDSAAGIRPIHMAWASACIGRVKPEDAILVNEYTLMPEHCGSNLPGTYFGSSTASGLGWGGGAALGAKLASPDRLVMAVLGDGSHLFGNPVAVHHASAMHKLPVLFVVMNNSMWGAVRRATLGMYPQGEAARSNKPPLIDLDDLPAFEQVCAAAGGYGERVEDPAMLPEALDRAIHAVTIEKRQALLNVICRGV
ncbi:MAG: thiamine pyrophosphate-requiring protein [Alphaproteobacteria bacterium]|nr:thiamine pyrophosphate-requiring protein [Alphaproteobacteria bacterium]